MMFSGLVLSLDFLDLVGKAAPTDGDFALTGQFLPDATDRVAGVKTLRYQRLEGRHFDPGLTPSVVCHNMPAS
jgi:hypothetical protein